MKVCICYAIVALLSLVIVLGLRGVMNVWNRMDTILKRLDDYPQLYDSYQKELQAWDGWWIRENLEGRAREASVLYQYLDSPVEESEKLAYIAQLLGAEEAYLISEQNQVSNENYYVDEASDSIVCTAFLDDGRSLSLRFPGSLQETRFSSSEITDSFIRRVEAGLPGHIMIQHEGTLSVYPKDEEGSALQQMVEEMLSRGELNPEEQRKAAKRAGKTSSVSWKYHVTDPELSQGSYILYCSAYTGNEDYVIGTVPLSAMLRLAGKRSWSLWFLYLSLAVLLGFFLWNIDTHLTSHEAASQSFRSRSRLFLATALMLLMFSILYIQQMSAVSQSEQAAADEASFLKYVLNDEAQRKQQILDDYDYMYTDRVMSLADMLSDHPEMADPYILYQLDTALGGSGLRITGLTGTPITSDRALIRPMAPNEEEDSKDSLTERVYQAVLKDSSGHADTMLCLTTRQQELNELLKETEPREVVEELMLLDTLHVVAVDHDQRDVVTACTNASWVGDDPQEHDVDASPFYDGYEGLLNFDGQSCYSIVFQYENTLFAVGSESVSIPVYLGGVLLLLIPLALLLIAGIYKPVKKAAQSLRLHEPDAASGTKSRGQSGSSRKELSPLRLVHGYMVAFFVNAVMMYAVTHGSSSGVTYNLVRGTWRHGINAITATTCITLTSMVFTIHLALDLLLRYLSKYFSQRGKTISKLLVNAAGYIGIIVVIVYTLSMFGMNTATLVGGVGAAALVFTLGANSLISDVLSGLFIIFDGDYVIGDRVEIGGFSGTVIDISIRNTSLEDPGTHKIKIIRNSMVKELINKSKNVVTSYIDFQIGRGVTLQEAEVRIRSVLNGLSQKYPLLTEDPFYTGVIGLPEIKPPGIPLEQCLIGVGYQCQEKDSFILGVAIREELLDTVNDLLFRPTDDAFRIRLDSTPQPEEPV